ncbi:hypothetical protein CEE36_04735 [candidate division TA06 bacterium B3_TA06]|uniref:Methyltransferase domain-containing protein n=1 Tax=candidate division TA06 bacterium B3_TA06 TaxID=2012487 RepID=A0A532V816_UNCT6|nr:MAG: hypothetical protein CEE36_04735 [candidate division TA06 bacterium B3_TA06]
MRRERKILTYFDEAAWDIIWKWKWFAKQTWKADFRESKEGTRRALSSLLPRLNVKSILDCSCGLGWKTILLAEMGYEVEGSDGSAIAVKYASQLAKEEGLRIKFFRSRWEELEKHSRRKFDCVYNDAFAWIMSRKSLEASARGIYSVLNKGGKFIFQGAHQWSEDSDKEKLIEEDLKKEGRFQVPAPYEKEGVKLIVLITREKTPDGILGNRIHIIEEKDQMRVEVASVLDLFKWTWQDYVSVLKKAGFREVYSAKENGRGAESYILNIGVK